MSDRRPPDPQDPEPNGKTEDAANLSMRKGSDPLELIEQCLASFPDSDPRQKILYKLRHAVIVSQAAQQQREVEFKKVADVIAKLTAPANRVGTLLEVPGEGLARILVGGAEYYAAVDPRVEAVELKIGAQILVNEAYAVIKILGYDRNGPVLKVAEALADGRLRFEQEMGRQVLILQRSSDLIGVDLKAGDEVRIDPSLHVAIEKLEDRKAKSHLLDDVPTVTWEQIGGQTEAIAAIQKAIEYPLLHADTFQRFKFTQPKGFLLYGPPGCGKTLIGQAAAASLSKLVGESGQGALRCEGGQAPGDSRGLSPHQGARDSEYVAGGIRTDGPGSLRPGPRSSEGGGSALYFHRRGGVGSRHETGLSFIQHLQHPGADVLCRDGRDRVVARGGHHSGFEPAGSDRSGCAAARAYRSQDQSEPSESRLGCVDSERVPDR